MYVSQLYCALMKQCCWHIDVIPNLLYYQLHPCYDHHFGGCNYIGPYG